MKTVCLLSGGVDSCVLLHSLLTDRDVVALSFDYGQRHSRELLSAARIARLAGVRHHIVSLDPSLFGGSLLTAGGSNSYVVPNRNMVMISMAAAFASSIGFDCVAIGCNAADIRGFPDCRPDFLQALGVALFSGCCISLEFPLSSLPRREIVALGKQLGASLSECWSCYIGGDEPCGGCPACVQGESSCTS